MGLLVVSALCVALELVPIAVIAGILGLVGVGIAGYDAVYEWLGRVERRRGAAKARREREHEGR
ncbi:hypothetical protein [Jiangella ureilytica]|uniref:hypothetical protein n=1 Tax=Jiangella ureilytica TaxID=2530374 RepID=UPI00193CB1FA|nr:hypothetical protein [Jiangella ureilytica]